MSVQDEDARAELGSCIYELDAQIRIISVDERWSEFAIANAAPELAKSQLIGQPLLAHISDRSTAHLYEQLFDKVLRTQRAVSVPFRCDSPSLRRFLELSIEPRVPEGIRLRTTLLRTEPRSAVPLLERTANRQGHPIRMCSFCKRVEAFGSWHEVEDTVAALRMFEGATVPPITHGVCPACFEHAMKRLAE